MEPWARALAVLLAHFEQQEVAGKLKVERVTVARWAGGERRPRKPHRRKLEQWALKAYPEEVATDE